MQGSSSAAAKPTQCASVARLRWTPSRAKWLAYLASSTSATSASVGRPYLTLKVDRQQSVLYISAPHFDMVSQLEAALESAGYDAAVEECTLLFRLVLPASDGKCVLLHLDLDVFLAESGYRHGDAILVRRKAVEAERLNDRAGKDQIS